MDCCSTLFDVVYLEGKEIVGALKIVRVLPDLKLFFFRTLLYWLSMCRNQSFSSIFDLLDLCNF